MPLNLDNIACISWSLDKPISLKSGMVFYEIELPKKYIEFNRIYVFSNINPGATSGRVYFQNAAKRFIDSTPQDYVSAKSVPYDGLRQAVEDNHRSTVCFSDPGVFLQGQATSWYAVFEGVDICFYIAQFLRCWFDAACLTPNQVLIFGSSAGTFGALRTSTLLGEKTNVISVNAQINKAFTYKGKNYRHNLIAYFGKCLSKKLAIPNIYILCNYRDNNTFLNRIFFETLLNYPYQNQGIYRPNIVFDLYDGLNGHLRPRRENLLKKIDMAEMVLKSSQEEQCFQRNNENKLA